MPGIDFDSVRHQVPITAVLQALGFQPASVRGDQQRGACPVHGARGTSRSFSVNVRLGRYRCFGCGSRGNALELWAAARRIDVYAAATELCEIVGAEVPWKMRW